MTTHRFIVFLFLILGGAINLVAQETKPEGEYKFSLKEAQEYALIHSSDMVISKLEIKKAEKQVGETRAMGLPQLNASADYKNFFDIATVLIPKDFQNPVPGEVAEAQFGTKHNLDANITYRQLIFSGSYIVALQATKAYKKLSDLDYKKTQTTVVSAVSEAYTSVLVSESLALVLDSMVVATQKNVNEMRAMHKAGFIDETDVEQLELVLSELENNIITTKARIEIARNVLKFNLGIPFSSEIILTDNIVTVLSGININSFLAAEFAVENNVEYQTAKNMVRVSQLQTKLEKSEALPTLSGFLSHTRTANRSEFNFANTDKKWYPTTLVGITLTIPIFSGFERHYKIQKAKVDYEIANERLKQVDRGLRLEFATAKNTYNSALLVYQNTAKNRKVAGKIYNRTQIKYSKGMATSLDLLQVHNQYLAKQREHFQALQAYFTAKSDLERILTKFEETK